MDRYSRLVALFKVLLPLAALAILATLFLISRGIDLDTAIPFAEHEISERLADQQITGPFFSGMTPNGDEIIVEARLARPGTSTSPGVAEDVFARMRTSAGVEITVNSNRAEVDTKEGVARLLEDVAVVTSTGMDLRTQLLETALSGVSGRSPGQVVGTSPLGELTAGSMSFAAKNGEGPLHMVFKRGVKLLYQPQNVD